MPLWKIIASSVILGVFRVILAVAVVPILVLATPLGWICDARARRRSLAKSIFQKQTGQ